MMINKKTNTFVMCCAALALLLVFSGCGGGGGTDPKVTITITGAPTAKYYSLNVFEENANVTHETPSGIDTGLRGWKKQGFGMGNATFELSEFEAGNYVLVLGCSDTMDSSKQQGAMYITASNSTTKKAVYVDFKIPITFAGNFLNEPKELEEIPPFFD